MAKSATSLFIDVTPADFSKQTQALLKIESDMLKALSVHKAKVFASMQKDGVVPVPAGYEIIRHQHMWGKLQVVVDLAKTKKASVRNVSLSEWMERQ